MLGLLDLDLPACSDVVSWVGDFGSRLLERGNVIVREERRDRETERQRDRETERQTLAMFHTWSWV